MKAALVVFGLMLLAVASGTAQAAAEAAGSAAYDSSAGKASSVTATISPAYRYVSTTGYPGRVAEYDALKSSAGGDVALSVTDSLRHTAWNVRGSFLNYKDYDLDTRLRSGTLLTLTARLASFVRHPDHEPFGRNLDPDNILHTDLIPQNALLGVSRTSASADARLRIPNTPLRLVALGSVQEHKGQCQLQYYDMGANPDTTTCDGCHQYSRPRDLRHVTSHVGAGIEMLSAHGTLAYQHDVRLFQDKRANPTDLFGTARSVPGEPLGAPDMLTGLYVHNVLPSHRSTSETVRGALVPWPSVSADGNLTAGRTKNDYTGHEQKYLSGDAAATWRATRELRATLEYHQQNTDNEFTPYYDLYHNPSIHRSWAEGKLGWSPRGKEVDLHYRYTSIIRPDAPVDPQLAYSPDNRDLLPLAHETTSNAVGASAGLHQGTLWNARLGYEYTDTHDPGYLTDPGQSHRVSLDAAATPNDRISISDDLSLLWESDFPTIERSNRLAINTADVEWRPADDWSLTALYAYGKNDLKTDLVFQTDPDIISESSVPYLASSHTVGVTSSWTPTKRLEWDVDARWVDSKSQFTSGLADTVVAPAVQYASAFSRVDVLQDRFSTNLDYRWVHGVTGGASFEYAEYRDAVHTEVDGILRRIFVYVGKTW